MTKLIGVTMIEPRVKEIIYNALMVGSDAYRNLFAMEEQIRAFVKTLKEEELKPVGVLKSEGAKAPEIGLYIPIEKIQQCTKENVNEHIFGFKFINTYLHNDDDEITTIEDLDKDDYFEINWFIYIKGTLVYFGVVDPTDTDLLTWHEVLRVFKNYDDVCIDDVYFVSSGFIIDQNETIFKSTEGVH